MTTGEGGAITTNNESYAKLFDIKLNHGAQLKQTGKRLEFVDFGFNFRMSELQAALGLSQIDKLDSIIEQRNLTFAIINRSSSQLASNRNFVITILSTMCSPLFLELPRVWTEIN